MTLFAAVVQSGRSSITVAGRVVSDDTSNPLPGVRVGVQGLSTRVETDGQGRFRLPVTTPTPVRITGWKAGYFISGTTWAGDQEPELRLRPHPEDDAPEYPWVSPNPDPAATDNCANCHAEIYRQWSASSHAQAAVNEHFLNTFYGTDWLGTSVVGWNFRQDQPDALAVCSACHMPTVMPGDAVAENPGTIRGVAREGIHCDFCHKIRDTAFSRSWDALGLQHGRDALRLVRPANNEQVFFGPLDDVDRGRDSFLPLYRSSVYCASCHEGTLFGMRVYETFSEWQASPAGRDGIQCQSCHMRPDGKAKNLAPGHGGIDRDPSSLSTHQFPGADDLDLLRSSVGLSISGTVEGSGIRAVVQLRPIEMGHKLPTGSAERHLILVVRATDAQGAPLKLLNGPVVPAAGGIGGAGDARALSGSPGKLFGKLFRGSDGSVPAPFWRAVALESDTRLKPDVVDESRYVFMNPGAGDITLQASVIYRRFYKAIADEKSWPDTDRVIADQRVELSSNLQVLESAP